MFKYPILILGCLSIAISSTISDEVPTMAISCGNTPLVNLPKHQQTMDTIGFKKLLSSFWNEDTKVVVALEDELSLEDITMKDSDGHSSFHLFENSKDLRFFPLVNQPEKAIEMLSKNDFSIKDYNDDIYANNTEKMIALVDLNDNNQNNKNRQSILQKHNNDFSKIFNNLCQQYTNVVLVLTGRHNPRIKKTEASDVHHLVTRHLMAANGVTPLKIIDPKKKSLIYSASYPTLSINNGPDTELQGKNYDVYIDDSRESLLKVTNTFLLNSTDKVVLRFCFERTTFTWELKSIECEMGSNTLLTPQKQISAQMGLSYFSEGPLIFSNGTTILKFNNAFQAQPWMKSNKFSDPQEQDSFFTPPILAGLFVTFLMLLIVTLGISMIMDIKTMDRFDDPKGKTIIVNVAE